MLHQHCEQRGAEVSYLEKNSDYWQGIYDAPNVESFIFRMYGRILRFDYGIDGSGGEKVFDFGMGQGGASDSSTSMASTSLVLTSQKMTFESHKGSFRNGRTSSE